MLGLSSERHRQRNASFFLKQLWINIGGISQPRHVNQSAYAVLRCQPWDKSNFLSIQ